MTNPPPVRPWFRLASIRSTPAPPQESHTTLGMPTFRTALALSSPQTHPTQPPLEPSSQPPLEPSSQPHKFSSSSLPNSSAEPKIVLVHETIDKPKPSHSGNTHHGKHHHTIGKESESKEKGLHKKVSDSEDSGMRVITIARENK
ncbi:hypothetical protein CR513_45604, partial [Mucuna pruriens]